MKKELIGIISEVKEEKIKRYKEIQESTASEKAKADMANRSLEVIGKTQMILNYFKEDENLEETLESKFGKDYVSEVKFLANGYINSILEAYIPNAAKRQVVAQARELGKKIVESN